VEVGPQALFHGQIMRGLGGGLGEGGGRIPPAHPKSFLSTIPADKKAFHRIAGDFGPVFQLRFGSDVVAADVTGLQFEIAAPDGADAVLLGIGDDVGGADEDAGAAADAGLGFFVKGRGHHFLRGAEGHGNGAHPHHFPAGADALGAEDAARLGVRLFKAGLVDPMLCRHLLDEFGRRGLGQ